jgi:hypothetical protein
VRGAEVALQPYESAVLHNSFTTKSLSGSTDVSIRYNLVKTHRSIVYMFNSKHLAELNLQVK